MKPITQAISCFLCCLLTMLTLCSCQTEAANNNDNQEDKKLPSAAARRLGSRKTEASEILMPQTPAAFLPCRR